MVQEILGMCGGSKVQIILFGTIELDEKTDSRGDLSHWDWHHHSMVGIPFEGSIQLLQISIILPPLLRVSTVYEIF